jgi:hypothetical protein
MMGEIISRNFAAVSPARQFNAKHFEKKETSMKFQAKSLLIRGALLGTLITTWERPYAAAQDCQPLTIASLPSYLPYTTDGFLFDDEGLASSASELFLNTIEVTNPATGAFTGNIGTLNAPSEYQVSGTLTQVGTSGLGITFGYALAPIIEATRYTYTGAIAVETAASSGETCVLSIGGIYTETGMLLQLKGGIITVTSGPYPFSGKLTYEGPE